MTKSRKKGEKKKIELKDVEIIPCSQIKELQTDFELSIASFGYTCVAPNIEIWGNAFDARSNE